MAVVYTFTIILFGCFSAVLGQSPSSPPQLPSSSGDSFSNGSSGSGDPIVVPPCTPRPVVVEDEPQCDWCTGRRVNQCQAEDHPGCKCDGKCALYEDCCADHPLCDPPDSSLEKDTVFASMECNTLYHSQYSTIYAETYWMVARCPEQVGWFGTDFQELAKECSFGSTAPVTDQETGIIYKNEFCAACHSDTVSSFIRWSFTYFCREEFMELLNMESILLDSLLEHCSPCRYVIPSSVYDNSPRELLPPRRCVVHVSTCLSYEQYLVNHDESLLLPKEQFENAVYHCKSDPYNAIGALTISRGELVWNLYRNIHCALCNGAAIPDSNQCTRYSSLFVTDLCLQDSLQFRPVMGTPQITFGLLLDINKDGVTTITRSTTEMVTSVTKLSTACCDNEVFDPLIGDCRQIICPPGYTASRGSCVVTSQGLLPPEGIAPNQTHISHPDNEDQKLVNPDSGTAPGNEDSTQTPTPVDTDVTPTAYCNLMTLRKGHDNFTIVGNDSVVYGGVTVTVVAFDDSHNPIICGVFTADNNASHTHISYHQKIKQIVPSFFIVPSLLVNSIAISLQLFLRKLHSVYGSVIINLALSFLLSDVFLLSIYHSQSSLDFLYFLWHTVSLAVVSWLCIFVMHISLAFHMSCNSQIVCLTFSQKITLLCMYLTFGWGPALVVALIKNEMYSEWGSCLRHDSLRILCEPMPSSLTFFIVPILVGVLLSALICVVISIKAIKSLQPLDKKIMHRFYIFLVLLIAFTLGWIFGFVYLLSPLPLVSAIAFFAFLSLKLATVLLFVFGLVFSKKARGVFQKTFSQKNKVHPDPQLPHKPPQIRIKEPTSISVVVENTLH